MAQLAIWLGRFVGLVFALLGMWVLVINLIERAYEGATLAWILAAGLSGAAGGILFLLSIDGPARFSGRRVRLIGWIGMLALALLPSSISLLLLLLIVLTIPLALRSEATSTVQASNGPPD